MQTWQTGLEWPQNVLVSSGSQCPELGAQGHTGCSIDLGQKAAQGLHQGCVSVENSNQNVHILLNSFVFLNMFHVFAGRGNQELATIPFLKTVVESCD